jgi:hypothetical protein
MYTCIYVCVCVCVCMYVCMHAYKQFILLVVLNIYRIACLQLSFLIFLTDLYFLYS